MTELPPVVTYGTVTGDLLKAIGDTEDPDTRPDRAGVPGAKITFTPSVPRVLFASPVKKVIMPAPIEVPLPHEAASFTGQFSVDLVATDNDAGNPVDWTYTVKVEVPDVETWEFPISVPTGSVEDLADLMPVAASEGTLTIRGPKGDPGEKGDPGPPGSTFDTGWRDVSNLMHPDWQGTLRVRRVGAQVTLAPVIPNAQDSGISTLVDPPPNPVLTLPVGFRPAGLVSLDGWSTQVTPGGAVDTTPGNGTALPVPLGEGWTWTTADPEPDPADWPGTPWTP